MSARILIPAEIIQQILSNLDTIDLLKCRRVSKSWNEQCLHVLKKNKSKSKPHHVKLDSTNIQTFLDFVTLTSASSSHVGPMPLFPWKFELDVWDGDGSISFPKLGKDFAHFKSRVNSLLNLFGQFGPECVDKVTYVNSFYDDANAELVPNGVKIPQLADFIVKLNLSAGLTEINIVNFEGDEFASIGTGIIPEFARIRLPNLTSFQLIGTQEDWPRPRDTNFIDLLCHDNMVNLEEFLVDGDKDDWYERLNFSKLKILDINKIDHAPALLENLRRSTPTLPVLQKFSVGFNPKNQAQVQVLTQVLACVATTLKSLSLITDFDGFCHEVSLVPLPLMPHLTNFRIDLRSSNACRYGERIYLINHVHGHVTPATLPVLENVDLPIRTEFMEGPWPGPAEFPNVARLILRILFEQAPFSDDVSSIDSDSKETTCSESKTNKRRREVEKLQKVFPNVRSLTVVKETLGLGENQAVKELLLGIMESSQGASLQELVIRNGDDEFKSTNFLAEILAEVNSYVSLTFRNLKEGRVTKEFEVAAQKFMLDWSGLSVLGETETEVSEVEEPGPVCSFSGDKRVAVTIQQRSPSVFVGTQNVRTIRLEQFSSTENERRRQVTKRSGKSHKSQGPLSPSEQRKQLLKNRREIELMVQNFPSLTQLQLSPVFFGQTKRSSCLEEIQDLTIRFPDLTIYLI